MYILCIRPQIKTCLSVCLSGSKPFISLHAVHKKFPYKDTIFPPILFTYCTIYIKKTTCVLTREPLCRQGEPCFLNHSEMPKKVKV